MLSKGVKILFIAILLFLGHQGVSQQYYIKHDQGNSVLYLIDGIDNSVKDSVNYFSSIKGFSYTLYGDKLYIVNEAIWTGYPRLLFLNFYQIRDNRLKVKGYLQITENNIKIADKLKFQVRDSMFFITYEAREKTVRKSYPLAFELKKTFNKMYSLFRKKLMRGL